MSYLLSNGTIVKDSESSVLDFLKINLLLNKGSVFNNFDYGKTYINLNDVNSIRDQLNEFIKTFNYDLIIDSIEIIDNKCVVVKFQGVKDKIVLNNEE